MNKGGRYRLYVNSTFNICDSIKIARLTPFVKLLYTHLTNHMNRELECPVKKVHTASKEVYVLWIFFFQDSYYTFTNCGQIAEYIPPYIPVGEYRLNFKYFIDIKRNPVFVTSMIVHVITEPINKRTKNWCLNPSSSSQSNLRLIVPFPTDSVVLIISLL